MVPESQKSGKTNDKIRDAILKFLYSQYQTARSVKGVGAKISKIKRELKKQGLTEQEIASNLTYLIQTGWVIEERETYPLRRGGRVIEAERLRYKISDAGVNHFEGPSRFQKVHRMTGINVMNIQGVTIVGDRNVVNVQYGELYRALDLLGLEVGLSDRLSDEDKLNYQAEIETIKSQLQKTKRIAIS